LILLHDLPYKYTYLIKILTCNNSASAQTHIDDLEKTLKTNPVRRCKLTHLRRNYSHPKIPNVTIV
jgi:hypothetical protein